MEQLKAIRAAEPSSSGGMYKTVTVNRPLGYGFFSLTDGFVPQKVWSVAIDQAINAEAALGWEVVSVDRTRNLVTLKRESATQPVVATAPDIPDQLRKLAELKEQGIVTDEEFQTKKAELLARL